MEKLKYLTNYQEEILQKFSENQFLGDTFYFTGGTALSSAYLQHRYSDDLDFFSQNKFDNFSIFATIQTWAGELGATLSSRTTGNVYNFDLTFSDGYRLKLDFAEYPYKNISEFTKAGELNIKIDSLKDIATNKFVTIGQRTDIKDFVDIYYLLKDFGVYDMLAWSDFKFNRRYDPVLFAADLLKIEQFEYMPRMIKKLSLQDLKDYFLDLAKKIGNKATR